MLKYIAAAMLLVTFVRMAHADEFIAVKDQRSVPETFDRLQKIVKDDGFFIVGHVPHSEAAKDAGLTLQPAELMIFGKPQSGTPLMVCDQRVGIDLPLRALPWEDGNKQVWLAMVDPHVLEQRYSLGADCDQVIDRMTTAVRTFLTEATAS